MLLATNAGGYWPTAWGWGSLVALWLIAVTLLVRRDHEIGRLEILQLVGLSGLLGWVLLSATWSSSPTFPFKEGERLALYLSVVGLLMLVVRAGSQRALLCGIWAAIALVCGYALLTQLFPDRYGRAPVPRLERPIGYWNALGLFASMGLILALGFVAHARAAPVRALAGASTVVLAATLYFTFSRGAWLALALGVLAAVATARQRLRLIVAALVIAPFVAACLWLAAREDALSTRDTALGDAADAGHRLAAAIAALAIAASLAALVLGALERRIKPSLTVRRAFAAVVAAAVIAGAVGVFLQYGAPQELARRGYDSLTGPPPPSTNLSGRLFSVSSQGRVQHWEVAWDEYRREPVLGTGAGSYAQSWHRLRPSAGKVLDAHSLYLEVLAELGPVGLLLLLTALAAPLAAIVRARRDPLAPLAFGVYLAFLAHAGIDWDWEIPGVTLAALGCGVAVLVAARRGEPRRLPVASRVAGLALVAVLGSASLVALIGNTALAGSSRATLAEDWSEAESDARRAIRWAPWSFEGWAALGEAQLQQGKLAEARASFREAIAKDSSQWSVWLDLAFASTGQARTAAARKALALNPRSPEIAPVRPALGLPPLPAPGAPVPGDS
jgi:O-antigen ligase